jgi:hypothetical protein
MTDDRYDEIVDGTVDEVKQRVRDSDDIDLEKVLEAEENGDDRVTLTEWLDEQIADAADDTGEYGLEDGDMADMGPDVETAPQPAAADMIGSRHVVFGAGVVTGAVLAVLVIMSGMLPAAGQPGADMTPPNAAADRLETYIMDNQDVFLPAQIQNRSTLAVQEVSPYQDSDLYQVRLNFTITQNGQSQSQRIPGYMTQDAEYVMFGGQLFALDTPAREQMDRPQSR